MIHGSANEIKLCELTYIGYFCYDIAILLVFLIYYSMAGNISFKKVPLCQVLDTVNYESHSSESEKAGVCTRLAKAARVH